MLKRVASEEEIALPDQAVGLIARKAAGSFRDALGTLEQLVTYGGSEISLDTVMASLGVAHADLIFEATDALIAATPKDALLTVNRLAESGSDYEQFMRDLSAHLRQLLVTQIGGQVPDTFAVTSGDPERMAKQAEALSQGDVLRAIDLLAAAIGAVKEGSEPRLQLEVALLKATQPQTDQSLQALMFRIDQLEARIGGQAAAAPAVEAPADPPAPKAAVVTGGASRGRRGGESMRTSSPVAAIDLERIVGLWSGVADAVREQNAMVAALVSQAVPVRARWRPPHRLVPGRRRLPQEEGRGQPRPRARRPAHPHRPRPRRGVRPQRGRPGERAPYPRGGGAARAAPHGVRRRGDPRRSRGVSMAKQPNMNDMMRQVQKMQADMAKAQDELKNETVEASAGGGMVTVKVSGEMEVLEVRIDPEGVDPEDVELLQDMVQAATNEALRSAQELAANKMGAVTGGLGGLGLPGL